MNGDLSRFRFDPQKAYSSVRTQQGRVALDADQNEETEIRLHDTRATRGDVLGPSGAPHDAPGMALSAPSGALRLAPGRYYVDGIRCQLTTTDGAPVALDRQPFPPDEALPTTAGLYVAYLDVWERPISAIQDPSTREVALGGPDTSIRTQVVWQVKLLKVTAPAGTPSCDTVFPEWERLRAGSSGTLQVREASAGTSTDPCVVTEQAGYRGLENQLYRVEVHTGNWDPAAPGGVNTATPTFKWSRDNGAVVAAWLGRPASLELLVDRLGPGGAKGFSRGEWIEVTDDADELTVRPGVLAEIEDISGSTLELDDPDGSVAAALGTPVASLHPQVRRWESAGARSVVVAASERGTSAATSDGWLRLEDGIEVSFGTGSFRSGDAWTFAARTAALPGTNGRHLEWAVDGSGNPRAQRAQGPRHHYARLALVQLTGTTWSVQQDCRAVFSSLVDQVSVDARGGDGQQGPSEHWLPAPLRVGVSRGRHPVARARVRFSLVTGGGGLSVTEPDENGTLPGSTTPVVAETNTEGVATVWWRLGAGPAWEERGDRYQPARAQQVVARLLTPGDVAEHVPVYFAATPVDGIVLKDAGGNGQLGKPGQTLEVALRVQVCEGVRPRAGARVRFSIDNRTVSGTPLDQTTGGALHASARLVSATPWPTGGTEAVELVVFTDADGIAQVQWTLGTDVRLTIQRVTARYLDDADRPTSQQMLFTAELALASAIVWKPCSALTPLLGGATDVQSALMAFCKLLGGGKVPVRVVPDWPELVKKVEVTPPRTGAATPLIPEATVSLARLGALSLVTAFELLGGSNPSRPSVDAETAKHAVRLSAETVLRSGTGANAAEVGHTVVRLDGELAIERASDKGATLTWTPARAARTWLAAQLKTAGARLRMELSLAPALLGAEGFTDASVLFTRGFWLTK